MCIGLQRFNSGKTALTLAEILITLGIIGVIAAMTLPMLIHSYKKQEIQTKIKKFYTNMSQAVKFSETVNGSAFYWSKEARLEDENHVLIANPTGAATFYNMYLADYLKTIETNNESGLLITFADGTTASISLGYCVDIMFDYNGKKVPNTLGIDRFDFLLCTEEGYNMGFIRTKQIAFDAYFPSNCVKKTCSRDTLLNYCEQNGLYCSALLINDGWEFKDDYPYKLR